MTAIAYGIVAFLDREIAWSALLKSLDLLRSIVPALLAVFTLMTLSSIFLDTERIRRLVGTGSGIKGWSVVIFGGMLSSGPIYLWYPLLADLRERGMNDGFTAGFLFARAVKLPLLPVMAFAFGWTFTIIFSLLLLLFSLLGGIATEKLMPNRID